MSGDVIKRVRYFEGQTVRAADLTAEQRYRLAMHRRHLVGLHGWGIVYGLELEVTEAGHLRIGRGLAVDGYGRYLHVPQPWLVEQTVLQKPPFAGESVDCWLVYARLPESPPLPERQVTRPGQHRRWRETAHIRLATAETERVNPYGTPFAEDPCRSYGPHEEPPDDPAQEWPVYLGRLNVNRTPPIDSKAKRPYATLRAAQIVPPSKQVQLQVGGQSAGDRRRFSLSLPGEGAGPAQEQLSLDSSGELRFHKRTILKPRPRGPEAAPLAAVKKLHFAAPKTVPKAASPWSVYRVQVEESGRTIDELRVEIALPEDAPDPSQYQFQIGTWQYGRFDAKLIVSADGSVAVNGDIDGPVTRSPIEPDLTEADFVAAMMQQSQDGLLASAVTFLPELGGTISVGVTANNHPSPGKSFTADVVLTNGEGIPVTALTLYARTVYAGSQIDFQVIDSGIDLQPTQEETYLLVIPIPNGIGPDGTIEVEVTAQGHGPFFNIVKDSCSIAEDLVP